jgi:tetratricopeptide (TPR) repeat protein
MQNYHALYVCCFLPHVLMSDCEAHAKRSYGIGIVFYRQERFAEAKKYFLHALRLSPKNPVLRAYASMVGGRRNVIATAFSDERALRCR